MMDKAEHTSPDRDPADADAAPAPESEAGTAPEQPPAADVRSFPGGAPTGEADAASTPTAEEVPVAAVELVRENEALKSRLMRLQADFENFRKRTQRERSELYLRANDDLMAELLPTLDDFELGLRNARHAGTNSSTLDGFQLIHEKLATALRKFGLEPIEVKGKPFDPHHHEALIQMPSPEVPAGRVLEELRRGYRVGDRLLRASQVVVSSGPPGSPEDPDIAPLESGESKED